MLKLKGIPINNGIIEGPAFIKANPLRILLRKKPEIIDPVAETKNYLQVLDKLKDEFQQLKKAQTHFSNKTNQQMADLYIAILNDPVFKKQIPKLIAEQKIEATFIIIQELNYIEQEFAKLNNDYFKSRVDDFKAIGHKILETLMGIGTYDHIKKPKIIIAESLSAGDLLHMPLEYIKGIITASGGATSHAAILAEALEIPAIFGVEGLIRHLSKKDTIIMDGYTGDVIFKPTPEVSKFYQELSIKHKKYEQDVLADAKGNSTMDGKYFSIMANIGNAHDVNLIHKYHADGVGLLRTETLVLLEESLLSEQEQSSYYNTILEETNSLPVYIRTLDLGGDKTITNSSITPLDEENPFLGFRSTRLFVTDPTEFKKQVHAILENYDTNPNIKIIIPFITTLDDFLTLKEVALECIKETINKPIPIGMMLEVPSAIICLEDYIPHSDFFSIGTNDLTQYILATDRNNSHVAHYHTPANPAIIRMLSYAGSICKKHDTPLSLCGEMGKESHFIRLLYGLGINTISMAPASIPMSRYILMHSTEDECKKVAENVLKMQHSHQIIDYLKQDLVEFLKKQNLYFDSEFIISNQDASEIV